jgi:hypothetical protein
MRLIAPFVKWIETFDNRHARNWAHLYRNDREAALWEAAVWGILSDCDVHVEPNADLDGAKRAPDFACHKDGHEFFTEATVIRIGTAEAKTSLPHLPDASPTAQHYANLNNAVFDQCWQKADQCSQVAAPCLLAIGTFHFEASALCVQKHHVENLLTGSTGFAMEIDREEGRAFGNPYQVTDLSKPSLFMKPGPTGISRARTSISALLIGGLGCSPPQMLGLPNPQPTYEFDRALLPYIEFCRVTCDLGANTLETEWI